METTAAGRRLLLHTVSTYVSHRLQITDVFIYIFPHCLRLSASPNEGPSHGYSGIQQLVSGSGCVYSVELKEKKHAEELSNWFSQGSVPKWVPTGGGLMSNLKHGGKIRTSGEASRVNVSLTCKKRREAPLVPHTLSTTTVCTYINPNSVQSYFVSYVVQRCLVLPDFAIDVSTGHYGRS